jgi:hypothetical protein
VIEVSLLRSNDTPILERLCDNVQIALHENALPMNALRVPDKRPAQT